MKRITLVLLLSGFLFNIHAAPNKDNTLKFEISSQVLISKISTDSILTLPLRLVLRNESELKTEIIQIGQFLKIETFDGFKIKGNLLSVSENSLILNSADGQKILNLKSIKNLSIQDTKSKRVLGKFLIATGIAITPFALFGTILTARFSGASSAIIPGIGTASTIALIPYGKSLVSIKNYKVKKWTISAE